MSRCRWLMQRRAFFFRQAGRFGRNRNHHRRVQAFELRRAAPDVEWRSACCGRSRDQGVGRTRSERRDPPAREGYPSGIHRPAEDAGLQVVQRTGWQCAALWQKLRPELNWAEYIRHAGRSIDPSQLHRHSVVRKFPLNGVADMARPMDASNPELLKMQKELLDTFEQASRGWLARVQSENEFVVGPRHQADVFPLGS